MKLGIREMICILLMAAIPLGSWWFVYRPRNARDDEMTRQIAAKQAKLRDLNDTIARFGDPKKEIKSLEEGITFLRTKLPAEKEIDKVLQDIWRLAEANQLITKSIRALDKSDGTFVAGTTHSEQPIAMKLEGDFRGFYAFMLALEGQQRIMRIKRMTLTKPDKMPDGFMQANFEMTVFFDSNDTEKGKI